MFAQRHIYRASVPNFVQDSCTKFHTISSTNDLVSDIWWQKDMKTVKSSIWTPQLTSESNLIVPVQFEGDYRALSLCRATPRSLALQGHTARSWSKPWRCAVHFFCIFLPVAASWEVMALLFHKMADCQDDKRDCGWRGEQSDKNWWSVLPTHLAISPRIPSWFLRSHQGAFHPKLVISNIAFTRVCEQYIVQHDTCGDLPWNLLNLIRKASAMGECAEII